jgi:hypothetical protein
LGLFMVFGVENLFLVYFHDTLELIFDLFVLFVLLSKSGLSDLIYDFSVEIVKPIFVLSLLFPYLRIYFCLFLHHYLLVDDFCCL